MNDIIPGQISYDVPADSPALGAARLEAVLTRGWNAYLVRVVVVVDGEIREWAGREVASYAAAEGVAKDFAARHGVPWHRVELLPG